MEKLKKIENALKDKPLFQLNIMDCSADKIIEYGVNQEYLNKNHGGSLPAYLEAIRGRGFNKLQLIPRLKNGTSSRTGGASVTVDFTNSNDQKNTSSNQAPAAPMFQGLNGTFGLGMPEIMDGFAAKRELAMVKDQFNTLLADYKEEKKKRQDLRDKLEKAERKNERYDYTQEIQRDPSPLDKLIDGLAQNPSAIPALIGAFKSGGLNAPQPQDAQIADPMEGYTDMQRGVCEMISQCPDNFCEEIATIISRVAEQDKGFIKDLKKVLETPILKSA